MDFLRSHLQEMVALHQSMFQKLLFEEDGTVSPDLAELFHDVGKTYLRVSERISEDCLSQHSLRD